MYDVIIIGAGVSGSSIARELSRYDAKIAVIEKEEDVCSGTSKANSGISHSGYDAASGSLMAKLNVQGNNMMERLSEELDFPYKRIGSLVLCIDEKDIYKLEELKERGEKNGVPNLEILNRQKLLEMEPNISDEVVAGLYAPTAGIVCPFSLNIAMAENANVNGVEFIFNTEVIGFEKEDDIWIVKTNNQSYKTKSVINASGVYSGHIHNMVSEDKIEIIYRRGDYLLLDKKEHGHVNHVIFQLPSKYGKGVLVAPTLDKNIIVGPTAIDVDEPYATNTTAEGIKEVIEKSQIAIKNLPLKSVITSFSGIRAHEKGHEFIIKEVEDAPMFFDCAGIESPGLTSAPAIGVMMADMVKDRLNLEKKDNFIARRKSIPKVHSLSKKEVAKLIEKDDRYAQIICRCEMITEGEIINAINRPLGAKTLDGLKRRVRATSGRCQGGFCTPRLLEILSKELGVDIEKISKNSPKSTLLTQRVK